MEMNTIEFFLRVIRRRESHGDEYHEFFTCDPLALVALLFLP